MICYIYIGFAPNLSNLIARYIREKLFNVLAYFREQLYVTKQQRKRKEGRKHEKKSVT